MTSSSRKTRIDITSVDEAIITLDNERSFCDALYDYARNSVIDFFEVDKGTIRYYQHSPFLGYAKSELLLHCLNKIVSQHVDQLMVVQVRDTRFTAHLVTHYENEIAERIKLGEIRLPAHIEAVLAAAYQDKPDPISKIMRNSGLSRNKINEILRSMREDAYKRYIKVIEGKAYRQVMSDCRPFIVDCPPHELCFTADDTGLNAELVEKGCLVAEWGSSKWFEVNSEYRHRHSVGTRTQSVVFPCRVIPKRFVKQAIDSRFVHYLEGHSLFKSPQGFCQAVENLSVFDK